MRVGDRKRAYVRYSGIALGLGAWLSLEYVALGPLSWMYGYGGTLETIPVHLALAKTRSTYALWAPFVAGGLDRLAFWGNADPFNVEALLFWAFPVWLANGLHVFAQRVIAIYFAARVAEEQLEMPPHWSALTGVRRHRDLAVSVAGHDKAMEHLERSRRIVPEPGGEPVEKFRVRRRAAHPAEVVRRIDEAASEMKLPDAVDDAAPGQWVARVGQPPGEFGATFEAVMTT